MLLCSTIYELKNYAICQKLFFCPASVFLWRHAGTFLEKGVKIDVVFKAAKRRNLPDGLFLSPEQNLCRVDAGGDDEVGNAYLHILVKVPVQLVPADEKALGDLGHAQVLIEILQDIGDHVRKIVVLGNGDILFFFLTVQPKRVGKHPECQLLICQGKLVFVPFHVHNQRNDLLDFPIISRQVENSCRGAVQKLLHGDYGILKVGKIIVSHVKSKPFFFIAVFLVIGKMNTVGRIDDDHGKVGVDKLTVDVGIGRYTVRHKQKFVALVGVKYGFIGGTAARSCHSLFNAEIIAVSLKRFHFDSFSPFAHTFFSLTFLFACILVLC